MSPRVLVVDDSVTIRKVVERTLSRAGYDVALAVDGQEGLEEAQREPPDLVLVDFVMPRMNGFQMAMALRGVANLRHVPIVLMSARAEKIAGQFMSQTGAVDAICKPFSPEALLAVTAHALDRPQPAHGLPSPSPFDATDDPTDPPSISSSTPSPFGTALDTGSFARVSSVPPAQRGSDPDVLRRLRAEGAVKAAGVLAEGLVSAVARATGVTVDPKLLGGALLAEGSEAFVGMLARAAAQSPGTLGIVALEGRIEHISLGDVLQLMQMQQQSGVLEIERGTRTAWIALRGGLVELASAKGVDPEFLLGRYLIEEELLEREDLEHLLRSRVDPQKSANTRRLLGDQLVKLGYITGEDLRRALVRQTSEIVYEVLRWGDGRYRFARYATRPEAESAHLGLPIASVLMEGLRRVDEWRLIEEQIHDFDVVFERNGDVIAGMDLDALSREERAVLSNVDGRRTVREVVEESRMSSFECCKALFQLATSRVLRRART